jgi:hypothetical protein
VSVIFRLPCSRERSATSRICYDASQCGDTSKQDYAAEDPFVDVFASACGQPHKEYTDGGFDRCRGEAVADA